MQPILIKGRYSIAAEGARHYIDIDHYGSYPYPELPHKWKDAVAKFGEDTLQSIWNCSVAYPGDAWQANQGF